MTVALKLYLRPIVFQTRFLTKVFFLGTKRYQGFTIEANESLFKLNTPLVSFISRRDFRRSLEQIIMIGFIADQSNQKLGEMLSKGSRSRLSRVVICSRLVYNKLELTS